MSELKEKTAKGLLWGGFSNALQQLLNLLFGIFLARLLTPADYGMVGMLTIFNAIACALQEGGFIAALTNRKNATHADYNAVFWFNVGVSLSLYLLLFLSAPLIARFYSVPALTPLARVCFLSFVISSLNIVPRAILFSRLKVKESTLATLGSLAISGLVGITLAYYGFAYWGIAMQTLTYVSMMTLLNGWLAHWYPTLPVDFTPVRQMIGFSSKLIITNLCTILNYNLFSVLLGKFYTEREVGNFTQANKWNSMGHTFITGMLTSVAQPVLTQVNEEPARQLAIFRKLLRLAAFISFPAMLGLSLVAEDLIVITLTDKWMACAHLLRLLCLWGAFVPITTLFSTLLVSRGHSSLFMWNNMIQSVVQLVVAFISYPYGLEWMMRCFVAINIGWLAIWYLFVRREINLHVGDFMRDISPYLLLSLALIFLIAWLTIEIESHILHMGCQMVSVALLYALVLKLSGSVIFKESIDFLIHKRIH